MADILNDERNSEARHRHLLEAAKKEHDRVREEAERVYREHLQKEERLRLLEEKRREEQRIRLEEQIAADRARVIALKAKKVEIPPPPPPESEPPKAPAATTSPPANASTPIPTPGVAPQPTTAQVNGTAAQSSASRVLPSVANLLGPPKQQAGTQHGFASMSAAAKGPLASPPILAPPAQTSAAIPISSNTQTNGVKPPTPAQPTNVVPPTPPAVDRHTQIHANLKKLRKGMAAQAETNKLLKGRMGDMRREIRKCVGQLTAGAGANKIQVSEKKK